MLNFIKISKKYHWPQLLETFPNILLSKAKMKLQKIKPLTTSRFIKIITSNPIPNQTISFPRPKSCEKVTQENLFGTKETPSMFACQKMLNEGK